MVYVVLRVQFFQHCLYQMKVFYIVTVIILYMFRAVSFERVHNINRRVSDKIIVRVMILNGII